MSKFIKMTCRETHRTGPVVHRTDYADASEVGLRRLQHHTGPVGHRTEVLERMFLSSLELERPSQRRDLDSLFSSTVSLPKVRSWFYWISLCHHERSVVYTRVVNTSAVEEHISLCSRDSPIVITDGLLSGTEASRWCTAQAL